MTERNKARLTRSFLSLALLLGGVAARAQTCTHAPVQLQLLGSGNGDFADTRAASSALLWIDGKARLLIDAGPGTALRFVQAGAHVTDLDAVLFTQLRAEHSADLPAIVQLPAPAARKRALPVYGPGGSRGMPSTVAFVRTLFDPTRGAWRHLGEVLSPLSRAAYKLQPHDVRPPAPRLGVTREQREEPVSVFDNDRLRVTALPHVAEMTPTLAWRIESRGRIFVLGANALRGEGFNDIAHDADVLIAAHTVADDATRGELAERHSVKQLVLTARGHTSLGKEEESEHTIRRHYPGALHFAEDLDCIVP